MIGNKLCLLAKIYITFFKLGCISFGGGYAMIPLIEREVVEGRKWVDGKKIIDIFAVSGSLPGTIALNSSAFVGYCVAGVPGAISALLGNLTPSVIVVLTFSVIFMKFRENTAVKSAFKGIYPAIVGLVSYASYKFGKSAIGDVKCIAIMILAFCAALFLGLDPITLIVCGALTGIAITFVKSIFVLKRNKDAIAKDGE